jgi:hypothetical protein
MSGKAQQQSRIKELITLGREQGYLTYAEVNDHLPEDISDPEQVEDIIRMINDMGINVFESAPDADPLCWPTPIPTKPRPKKQRSAGSGRDRHRSHDRPGAHVHARNGY